MKQRGHGLNLSVKRTRKRKVLDKLERMVQWAATVEVAQSHYPNAETGRLPFSIETMLRIYYLQQRFALPNPATTRPRSCSSAI